MYNKELTETPADPKIKERAKLFLLKMAGLLNEFPEFCISATQTGDVAFESESFPHYILYMQDLLANEDEMTMAEDIRAVIEALY